MKDKLKNIYILKKGKEIKEQYLPYIKNIIKVLFDITKSLSYILILPTLLVVSLLFVTDSKKNETFLLNNLLDENGSKQYRQTSDNDATLLKSSSEIKPDISYNKSLLVSIIVLLLFFGLLESSTYTMMKNINRSEDIKFYKKQFSNQVFIQLSIITLFITTYLFFFILFNIDLFTYIKLEYLKILKTLFSVFISISSYTIMMFIAFTIQMFNKCLFTQDYNSYFLVIIGILFINSSTNFISYIETSPIYFKDYSISHFISPILIGLAPNLLFVIYDTFNQYKNKHSSLGDDMLLTEQTENRNKIELVVKTFQKHNMHTIDDILAQQFYIYRHLLWPISPNHTLVEIWLEKLIIKKVVGKENYAYVKNTLNCFSLRQLREISLPNSNNTSCDSELKNYIKSRLESKSTILYIQSLCHLISGQCIDKITNDIECLIDCIDKKQCPTYQCQKPRVIQQPITKPI